jgi:hypothetical protein
MADLLVTMSYKYLDDLGVSTSDDHIVVKFPDTTTLATIQTVVNTLTAILDAASDAQITLITGKIDLDIVGAKSSPVNGSEVERTGLINMTQAGVPWKFGVPVPSVAESLIDASGKLNIVSTAISDLFDWLEATHSGGTPVSKYGLVLTGLADVLITFRKHRKAETRRSLEV